MKIVALSECYVNCTIHAQMAIIFAEYAACIGRMSNLSSLCSHEAALLGFWPINGYVHVHMYSHLSSPCNTILLPMIISYSYMAGICLVLARRANTRLCLPYNRLVRC